MRSDANQLRQQQQQQQQHPSQTQLESNDAQTLVVAGEVRDSDRPLAMAGRSEHQLAGSRLDQSPPASQCSQFVRRQSIRRKNNRSSVAKSTCSGATKLPEALSELAPAGGDDKRADKLAVAPEDAKRQLAAAQLSAKGQVPVNPLASSQLAEGRPNEQSAAPAPPTGAQRSRPEPANSNQTPAGLSQREAADGKEKKLITTNDISQSLAPNTHRSTATSETHRQQQHQQAKQPQISATRSLSLLLFGLFDRSFTSKHHQQQQVKHEREQHQAQQLIGKLKVSRPVANENREHCNQAEQRQKLQQASKRQKNAPPTNIGASNIEPELQKAKPSERATSIKNPHLIGDINNCDTNCGDNNINIDKNKNNNKSKSSRSRGSVLGGNIINRPSSNQVARLARHQQQALGSSSRDAGTNQMGSLRQLTAAIMLSSYLLLALISFTLLIEGQQVVNPNKLLSTRHKLSSASSRNLDSSIAGLTSGSSTTTTTTTTTSSSSSAGATSVASQGVPGAKEGKLLVCYYTNWSQYRPKEGKYVPEDIDPHLCTHVIVAFGWMKKNRLAPFDASDESKDGKKGLYERVTSLKAANPSLKVLIAVGGWSFGTERFKTMAANRYNRQLFIFSALEFLRERNFDGLDIDWEFPQASDKKNFVDLLKELREAFDAEAKDKRLPKLLLTCAVSAGAETVRAGYDVAPIGAYVDFINIMSYDFHGKWESKTGHNAPLFASAGESEWRKQLSMDFGVKLWERMGAPKSKLVVGLATYGRSFTLASSSQHGMNAPSSGGGKAGEFTKEAGFLAFYEICDMLKQGASYYWDEEQAVPYAVQGDQWVGFDDELSIRNKVKWLNEQGFAGAMVWALDMDDFKGTCTPKKYPLIRAMAEGLFNLPVRPSQEWRIIIEAARARANSAAAAAATAAGSSVSKLVAGGPGGAGGSGQTPAELAAAAAVAAAAAANSILSSAGINNPATAEAIRSAIAALGPSALVNGGGSELANQLKQIPGLNLTSLLTSPSALAALTAANPQLASSLLAQQNRSLETTNARIVCYYTNWSYKRPGAGKFGPDNLDPNLCTHIIYAFYGLKDSKLVPTEEIDSVDNEQAPYKRIIALKQVNPNLKVMLAVGGWMMGFAPFRQLTENAYRQTFFTFEVIEFLRKKQFDGLDLCWEFPRGLDDKEKFSNLVKELRESFDGEAKSSGKPRLILSAAVPASFEAIAAGYDVPVINKYLDFMNVMTYDFHGDWEQVVGHNSPLYPLNSATAYQRKLTLDFSAAEWVRQGASKENLVIGLPTYGRTFTLANPNLTDIDAPAARGGKPGQFTKESGFLSFFEVCEMLKNQATLVWDNEQMIPYAYKGDQWVGFDDPRSFKMKVQWLKQNGYSGIMIWSVDMDDFAGTCMGLKYPLIKSAKEELKGYYVPNLVESAQGSSMHPSIGLKDKDELQCEETDGHITYHKDKKDCTMYYMCEGSRKHHMPCPQNLVFNQNENVCDWPENVEGCGTKLPTETSATPTG